MRARPLVLPNVSKERDQLIRAEIQKIAIANNACLSISNHDERFELATSIYIQRQSGYLPMGRDEYGLFRPTMKILGTMIDTMETTSKETWPSELKKVLDMAMAERRWVWEHPLLDL